MTHKKAGGRIALVRTPVSNADAVTARCPQCQARPGWPCVTVSKTPAYWMHKQRRMHYWESRRAALESTVAAIREHDRQETKRLRRWFAEHGHLFTELGGDAS